MLKSIRSIVAQAGFLLIAVGGTSQAQRFDHGSYDALLRRHVVDGFVDYDAFAKDPSFTQYLESLYRVNPATLEENERAAFWINAYNAYTVRLITTHNERESIRNINRTLGLLRLKGPWNEEIVRAGGRVMSLDELQHTIIRREFTDPRIHFALACGAVSCPPLRSEAYTGDKLDAQLKDQGAAFLVRSPHLNELDVKRRTFRGSILFKSYRSDFGITRKELGQFLSGWYTDSASKAVLDSGYLRMVEMPFDWSLNSKEARGRRQLPRSGNQR